MLQKYCFLSEPPHVFTHFLRECAIAQLEMVFATPLREPFQVKWSLRRRRKSHPERNGLCDAVARAIPSEMVFATPSREPFQVKWSLRRRRESHPKRNGLCDAVARAISSEMKPLTAAGSPSRFGFFPKRFSNIRTFKRALIELFSKFAADFPNRKKLLCKRT